MILLFYCYNQSYLTKLMDEDVARKLGDIKTPSDNEAEIEQYENCVMEIKNQSVGLII